MKQHSINTCKKVIVDFFSPCKQNVSPSLIFFKGEDKSPLYGVFTLNNQEGFVIVDFINGMPEVSAFSPDGVLTEDIINNNDILTKNFALYERKLKNKEITVKRDSIKKAPRNESFYLLSTRWAQEHPFNLFIPDGLLVGCVATAAAQIIRFFEMQPTGIIPEYETETYRFIISEINLDNYIYDWRNMPNRVESGITNEEKENLSLVSFHAAAGVKMDFRNGASAAFVDDAMLLLKNHFSFSHYMRHVNFGVEEDSYLDSDVANILYFELTNKRPVLIAGAAHAFVADGIAFDNNLFHFNFGFGGTTDGFYSVSRPGLWSIEEMVFNIHTMTDDKVRTTSPILLVEHMDKLSHGEQFNINVNIFNISNKSVSVAACLTSLSSAFLHKISEIYTFPPDLNTQHTELSAIIPESANLSPRKIQLMWKYLDEEYGWRLVEPIDEEQDHALPVIITARKNDKILLNVPLVDIINQNTHDVFTYNLEATNTTSESEVIKCILAITDKHDNILHIVGESKLTHMLPGSTTQLSLNCSLEGVKHNVMHQARIFYSTENGYRYLMMAVDDSFKNMISIWAVIPIEFRNDIIISGIRNFPDDRVFTWAKPFTLEIDVITDGYTENTLPINQFTVFIYDDTYNITDLKTLTGVAIKDQSTFHLKFPISIPITIKDGNYKFAIAFRSPQHNHRHQIISSDVYIDNPTEVMVAQTILLPYLRLAESLVVPAQINSNSNFILPVTFIMNAPSVYDGLMYMFGAKVLLTSKGTRHAISTLPAYAAGNNTKTYYNFECSVPDIAPGIYILSIYAYDYYFPTNSITLSGQDESIIAEVEIIII